MNSARIETAFACPGGERLCTSVHSDEPSSAGKSSIVRLLLWCRPSAVVWRVSSLVVATINAGSLRSWTHVYREGREVVQPLVTHLNTSAAVVLVIIVLGIQATSLHFLPAFIFCRATATVFGVAMDEVFSQQATARLHQTALDVTRVNQFLSAAIALAQPVSMVRFTCFRHHHQSDDQ